MADVRLLVATDDSRSGRDARELGRTLSAAAGATLREVTVPADDASPAEELKALSGDGRFDGIVIGSPHHRGLERLLVGGVAAGVLHEAEVDVFVAPPGYSEHPHDGLKTIAVGYLSTPESDAALRRAEELLEPGGEIKLMTVAEPPLALSFAGPKVAVPDDPEAVLSEGLATLPREMEVETRHLSGTAAHQLEVACARGVDLLVLGSRSFGPVRRALFGSVSGQLLRHAPCPLLVTRRS